MKPYQRPVSPIWWLKRRPYFLFIIRELTAVFVAFYAIILLILVAKLGSGKAPYEAMLVLLGSPGMIFLHIVAFIFTVYHSITWFNLTPKAMVVRIGEEKVPGIIIAGSNYVAWLVLSGMLVWIVLNL